MSTWAIRALRAVIVVALAGSAVVQGLVVASLWWGTERAPDGFAIAFVTIAVLGIATLQVIAVSVWRLLTMVGHGTVFSFAAFRHVNVIIAALSAAAGLMFSVAVVARFANHAHPEDEVAPGLVALVCGFALVIGGVALLVYVLRSLLAQAVALDSEARSLKSELDEVI